MVRDTVKRIVLCEGKHDLILFSLLLRKNRIPFDTKTWGQIEARGEINIIREFLGKRGRGKSLLIKEEHGRNNCIEHFSLLYGYGDDRYSVKVIMDNDGGYCLKTLQQKMRVEHTDVYLSQIDGCRYALTTSEIYQVFIYPTTLTWSVKNTLGMTPDFNHGDDELSDLFSKYLQNEKAPEWIGELEKFLME